MIRSNLHILKTLGFLFSVPALNNAVHSGRLGLEDESAGKSICEKQFHYTFNNREASKRQLPLFTMLNTLRISQASKTTYCQQVPFFLVKS